MLGELIYEGRGRITGQRVLDVEGPKIEVSNSGTGKFKDVEVTEMWTEVGVRRPGGAIFGRAHGIFMTKDNREKAEATVYGVSPVTGSRQKRYVGGMYFRTSSNGKLGFLNNIVGVNEYVVDDSGDYYHKVWQWK